TRLPSLASLRELRAARHPSQDLLQILAAPRAVPPRGIPEIGEEQKRRPTWWMRTRPGCASAQRSLSELGSARGHVAGSHSFLLRRDTGRTASYQRPATWPPSTLRVTPVTCLALSR